MMDIWHHRSYWKHNKKIGKNENLGFDKHILDDGVGFCGQMLAFDAFLVDFWKIFLLS